LINSHNFERLRSHILPMSKAGNFDDARSEWSMFDVHISEEFDECPCGQPIKELCYIKNSLTRHQTYVGNVCINRFLGIDTGNLFTGLKRIIDNPEANPNKDLIIHAEDMGYLYAQEYNFLMSTKNKRKLTPKQLNWKVKINRRIISQVQARPNKK